MTRWIHEEAECRDAEVARKLEEYYMELGKSYMKGEGVEKNERRRRRRGSRKAAELKSKGTASPETPSAPVSHVVPPMKRGRRKLRSTAAAMVMMLVMGGGIGAYCMLRDDPYVAYQRLIKEGKEGEAMEHLHVAAEDGNVSAQADLGLCHANGRGVSGDMSIPAAVTEAIYVSDRAHVDYISTPAGARRAAHAVAQGILTWLGTR